MKVFITGATGFIGCAIVNELLTSGHKILGLARSERSTITLQPMGAEVHKGNLEDLQSLPTLPQNLTPLFTVHIEMIFQKLNRIIIRKRSLLML